MKSYNKLPRAIRVKRDERNGMGTVLTDKWEVCGKDTPEVYYNAFCVFSAITNVQDMVRNEHDYELIEEVKNRIKKWMDRP